MLFQVMMFNLHCILGEKELYQLLEIQIHLFLPNHPGTEKANATLP